jgi:hypothetical protein
MRKYPKTVIFSSIYSQNNDLKYIRLLDGIRISFNVKKTEISWYINMSPFNRFLLMDVLKAVGLTAVTIGAAQILPIPPVITDFITDVGGVVLIIYLFSTLLKQFSSFSGISIRFILDETGATMMEDHDASGMKYVAQQVSSMRWAPMHAGSFRAENIKPRVPKLSWDRVFKGTDNVQVNVIVLHSGLGGSMRLFCNEDNYNEVLSYVNSRVNRERYVN